MKTLRMHCLHRSAASSVAAVVISLAAALTAASPAAAQTDQPSDRQACRVIDQRRGGFEQAVWALMGGPQAGTVLQNYCTPQHQDQGDGQRQDQGDGRRQDQGDGRTQTDDARALPASGDMTDIGRGDADGQD
ncbi:hypothetical protein ACFV7R_21660 [Streptomyces sp. NPDC059866]|uniref:hypothetical protein n=1 Tax=Streptomyces sp. NPDC059866 TaxID=3346978 RepID=UPI0036612C74